MLVNINNKYQNLSVYLKEAWESRHILNSLFRTNVLGAHRGKILGNMWNLLDPLLELLIWVFIFQIIFRIGKEDYPLYLFCAISCWRFISGSWSKGMNSIRGMGNLLLQVNLPKVILPLNAVLASLYSFGYAFIILFIMLFIYGKTPNVNILYFPVVLFVMIVLAVGGGFLLAAIQTFLPDLEKVFVYLLRILWFASPGLYTINRIPEQYHDIYQLNPMVGLFESFRNTLLYGKPPAWESFMITCVFALLLLIAGFTAFYRTEPYMTKKL